MVLFAFLLPVNSLCSSVGIPTKSSISRTPASDSILTGSKILNFSGYFSANFAALAVYSSQYCSRAS